MRNYKFKRAVQTPTSSHGTTRNYALSVIYHSQYVKCEPKGVTSGGAHFRGLAKKRRSVGETLATQRLIIPNRKSNPTLSTPIAMSEQLIFDLTLLGTKEKFMLQQCT